MFKTTFSSQKFELKEHFQKAAFFACHVWNSMKLFFNLQLFATDHNCIISLPPLSLIHPYPLYKNKLSILQVSHLELLE